VVADREIEVWPEDTLRAIQCVIDNVQPERHPVNGSGQIPSCGSKIRQKIIQTIVLCPTMFGKIEINTTRKIK